MDCCACATNLLMQDGSRARTEFTLDRCAREHLQLHEELLGEARESSVQND
jgi:hypothetical protein